MEWALAGLFIISALLLIFSILKTSKSAKEEHHQIDLVHIATMKEIEALKQLLRNMELDMEVVTKKAGIQLSLDEIRFTREVLDLYKRNYSIASIAEKKQVPENEIEQMLAPFQKLTDEGSQAANEN